MGQPENEQKAKKDSCDGNTLTKEIYSWSNFEYALREESRLFCRIIVYGIDIAAAKDNKGFDCQCQSVKSQNDDNILLLILSVAKIY